MNVNDVALACGAAYTAIDTSSFREAAEVRTTLVPFVAV